MSYPRLKPRNVGGKPVPNRNKLGKPPTLTDLGVDRKTSMIAQKLAELPPDRRAAIAAGEISITQAERTQRAERIKTAVSLPDARYRVLLADPPWSYGKAIKRAEDAKLLPR